MPLTYAITLLTHQRRALFTRTANADLFLEHLFHHQTQGNYHLHAFAIMPDHVHAILTPATTLPRCIQQIKGGFSHKLRNQFQGEIWHPGHYEHRIRDTEDFHNQKTYIAQNPTRRHLANHPYVHTNHTERIDPIPPHLR